MIYRLILLIAQETQNVFSFCEKQKNAEDKTI